ncbi:KEOPS complex subunit Pcc1 [Halomarina salina]|uniref:KEOPS complex subunit Pcc1 n=1 Tax=Halomarina salina TaxID=1872699 RepID=A0ABD5RIU4_9EURY
MRDSETPTDGDETEAADAAPALDRTATVRVTFADGETARQVAAALAPDDTSEMATRVDGPTVETTITRETTGGLRTTADDYVSNLQVAQQLTDTTSP